MASRQLGDQGARRWCCWAGSSLRRLGVTGDMTRPAFVALALDLSDNDIGDEGVTALVEMLRSLCSVRLQILKLHKNRLGFSSAKVLGQFIREKAELAPSFQALPEELHLSHNKLGEAGILILLEAVAGAGQQSPSYPQWPPWAQQAKPLWIRAECNGTDDNFLGMAAQRLAEVRKEAGWEVGDARLLCTAGKSCTKARCAFQQGSDGPVAHLCIQERETPERPGKPEKPERPEKEGFQEVARRVAEARVTASPAQANVVLHAGCIGWTFCHEVLKQDFAYSWKGLQSACEYYRSRGVQVHIVMSNRTLSSRSVPEDIACDVIRVPQGTLQPSQDTLLAFLSNALQCQYVSNSSLRVPELQHWLTSRTDLKVEFLFSSSGSFVPLKPFVSP